MIELPHINEGFSGLFYTMSDKTSLWYDHEKRVKLYSFYWVNYFLNCFRKYLVLPHKLKDFNKTQTHDSIKHFFFSLKANKNMSNYCI